MECYRSEVLVQVIPTACKHALVVVVVNIIINGLLNYPRMCAETKVGTNNWATTHTFPACRTEGEAWKGK